MKVIKTFTDNSYSYDGQKTFMVPAFSKILNMFIEHSNMTILVEYDDLEEETKTIMVRTKEGLNFSEEISNLSYQYWGTITQINSSLINNSSTVVGGVNISMNIFNENKYIHIFYLEIKPLCEIRDDKLNNLI